MASPLVEQGWLYATVPIQNQWGGSGTGFLVYREIAPHEGRAFLITNKHVIHRDPVLRATANHIVCRFTVQEPAGHEGTILSDVRLAFDDGVKRYREHPDADTDVLAVEVTDIMDLNSQIVKRWVGYESFADAGVREELEISVGEDIVTIGYPLGFRQGETNFPLLRQGLIATRIGYRFRDTIQNPDGSLRERSLRAFLIDGATVPGSSGSPVVLKPAIGRLIKGAVIGDPAPPVLLGIVAETRYAPIDIGAGVVLPGFADLGLAFEVETIRETVELFFPAPAGWTQTDP